MATEPEPTPVRNDWKDRHLPCHVYEFYDDKGDAVYVGRTRNLANRLRTHQQDPRGIWLEVAEIHTTRYRNHDEATYQETLLIKALQPRWNFQHTERAVEGARERHRQRKARLNAAS